MKRKWETDHKFSIQSQVDTMQVIDWTAALSRMRLYGLPNEIIDAVRDTAPSMVLVELMNTLRKLPSDIIRPGG